jgi:hypothetical protein
MKNNRKMTCHNQHIDFSFNSKIPETKKYRKRKNFGEIHLGFPRKTKLKFNESSDKENESIRGSVQKTNLAFSDVQKDKDFQL